jgi:hypothetical protein
MHSRPPLASVTHHHVGSPKFLANLSARAALSHPGQPGGPNIDPLYFHRLQASPLKAGWPLPL